MEDDSNIGALDLVALTAETVAAYVGNNTVDRSTLVALIGSVHGAFSGLGAPAPIDLGPKPAVPVKKSITKDYLVSLEDGSRHKTLKRHLRVRHNMTPEQYREKWDLPRDYPMVAPSYAARRSDLAKSYGFGKFSRQTRKG